MNQLYIVDIMGMFFRAVHAMPPLTNSVGVPTGAVYGFAKQLLAFLDKHKPKYIVAVWDAPARSFRKDLSPDYKAHRTPLEPHVKSQIKLARAVVRALPLPVLQIPGVEADDVIATLALRAAAEGFLPVIVTSDKDLWTLVGPAELYDPMKNLWIDINAVVDKWGVEPDQISDLLTLTGDAVDNIKGVPGIGPKTAAVLLLEYGDLQGVIDNSDKVKGKRGEALRAAIADGTLELARKLVSLKLDVELPIGPHDMALPEPNLIMTEFLFKKLEFFSLLPSDQMPTIEELKQETPKFDANGRKA